MPDVGKVTGTISFKDQATAQLSGFTKKLKSVKVGWKLAAAGAAVFGAAVLKSMHAMDEQVMSINKLGLALANQGSFSKEAMKNIQELASAQQGLTAYGDEATLAAAASGVQMGMNADSLEQLIPLVQDYAAAMDKDLKVAFMDVGKSMSGQISTLARYGIKTNEAMSETERMAVVVEGLTTKFGGSAQLQVESYAGKLVQVKNALGDVFEQAGLFINYLMGSFGGGIESSISILEKLGDFFGKTLPTVVSEARALFAEFLAFLMDTVAKITEVINKIPGMETQHDPEYYREIAKGQRELAVTLRDEADAFVAAGITGSDYKNIVGGVSSSVADAAGATKKFEERMRKLGQAAKEERAEMERFRETADAIAKQATIEGYAIKDAAAAKEHAISQQAILDAMVDTLPPFDLFAKGMTDVVDKENALIESQKIFNEGLRVANDLAQLVGGTFGSIVGQISGLGSTLKSLSVAGGGGIGGIFGGISSAFTAGKGEATGIMGTISGAFGAAGAIGQLASVGMQMGGMMIKGIKKIFSIGGPDIARDVARDIGPSISKELEKSIIASGKPAQLAIGAIFKEGFATGSATADMFAEEIGDLFSFFGRGEITKFDLVGALEESVPMLIERLQELGPAGEEQLNRIIGAAQSMGIEFEGLSELIEGTFAPDTMESIAKQFDMTNDQVRELAGLLGVDVQTELERMASSLGLSVDEFKTLGAAVEEKFGIPMEDIGALLESMGISAADLADKLGVEVSDNAGELDDELKNSTEEMKLGADQASRMADALERAARAAGGIVVPSGSIPGMQHGGIVDQPQLTIIGESPEVVAPVKALFGSLGDEIANRVVARGGGGGRDINFDFSNATVLDHEGLITMVTEGIRDSGIASEHVKEGVDRLGG